MSYLSNIERESSFGSFLWLKWLAVSLLGWTGLLFSIFYLEEYTSIIGGIVTSSIFIGLSQWINIRHVFTWAKSWIMVIIFMIPFGLAYAATLGTLILAVGINGGVVGKELMGVVGGIFLPAISIGIVYALYMYITSKIVRRLVARVEGNRVIILEQIVVIGFAVTIALTVNVLIGLFDTNAGILAGGVIFGLITGWGINEVGLPTRWAKMETKQEVNLNPE
ncbi:MAG: hypothetical protein ACW98F_19630 [Candidatus Hodarchaeales archaeon]|jgi:hypothetical protein